jgi:predicted transcriptional regulator
MRTTEEMRQYLSEHNLKAVAEACGVHHNALYRFMKGDTDPRVSTWEKLNQYIDKKEQTINDN